MENKSIYHCPGEFATWDSFSGMIACKVLEIIPNNQIRIKITAKNNPCYKSNEIVKTSRNRVYPRKSWHKSKRGTNWIWVEPYKWIETE